MVFGGRYLLRLVHEHVPFRQPEIQSLLSMFNIPFSWIDCNPSHPFIVARFESLEDVQKLMSRSVLIKSVYELWGEGTTKKALQDQLSLLPFDKLGKYFRADKSFKIHVEAFGKKLSLATKIEKMEELDFLPFEGPIQMNDPDFTFELLEFYGMDPNAKLELPLRVFFGRWICDGQRRSIYDINLSNRKFIGSTTMDPTLSLIMINQAQIRKGHLVLDPFVGSGSLLIAAAKFGAYVMGTDIDYLMLHGKAKPTRYNAKVREPDESIQSNLSQYKMDSQYIDVVVADTSLPLWRNNLLFDAIITDPPYGIREPTERIGSKKKYSIPGHLAEKHIPSKVGYSLGDIMTDLVNLSAKHLRLSGRLVFWLPCIKEEFTESCIPCHPCFKLISYSEQTLTKQASRYLVTMEKTKEFLDSKETATVSESTNRFRLKYFQSRKLL